MVIGIGPESPTSQIIGCENHQILLYVDEDSHSQGHILGKLLHNKKFPGTAIKAGLNHQRISPEFKLSFILIKRIFNSSSNACLEHKAKANKELQLSECR